MSSEVLGEYTKAHRALEFLFIAIFVTLYVFVGYQIFLITTDWLTVVFHFFFAALVADFLTGTVHWSADTWGKPSWPILGEGFIRPFREHHVTPIEITKHGFLETNGNNALVSIPPLMISTFQMQTGDTFSLHTQYFLFFLSSWGIFTNQFHKWAHVESPPKLVRLLQKCHLILPHHEHEKHHRKQFIKCYGITNGWSNLILDKLCYWRILEWGISKLTGAIPRESDREVERILASSEPS